MHFLYNKSIICSTLQRVNGGENFTTMSQKPIYKIAVQNLTLHPPERLVEWASQLKGNACGSHGSNITITPMCSMFDRKCEKKGGKAGNGTPSTNGEAIS